MQFRLVGAESLCGRTDGRTDRHDEVNNHIHSFANVPKKTGNLLRDLEYTCLQNTFLLYTLLTLRFFCSSVGLC
jgi:hypothetical protein